MAFTDPRPNDYIQVSVTLFENPKLANIADEHGPQIYSLWIYILISTKRARHLGKVTLNPVRVARMVGLEAALTSSLIESLVKCRSLLKVESDDGHLYEVRNWSRWQSLSKAERERNRRARIKHEEAAAGHVGAENTHSGTTQDETRRDNTIREEILSGEVDDADLVAQSAAPPLDGQRTIDVGTVFEYWKAVAAPVQLAEPTRAKLSPERRKHINARLDDGYTVGELCECIDGYTADPWFRGEDPKNQTPYLEVENIMRNAKKVDAGVTKKRRGVKTPVAVGSEQGRPSRVRPQ